MREVIFRGQTDTGEWFQGSLIQKKYKREPFIYREIEGTRGVVYEKVKPETVGEFTGLKDKTGRMVFEGDIIKIREWENSSGGLKYEERELFAVDDLKGKMECEYVSEVFHEDGGFSVHCGDSCDMGLGALFGDMRFSFPIYEFEILGNVVDDPELINK